MGIPVKSGYWISRFLDYRRSRLLWAQYLPLAFFIALSSLASADSLTRSALDWPLRLYLWILAFLLITQFRLWDDLADLKVDRCNHPERVLCRVKATFPFWIAVMVLAVMNISGLAELENLLGIQATSDFLIRIPWQMASMFSVLMLWYMAWYAWHAKFSENYGFDSQPGLFRSLANLIKYPAFVIILASHLFASAGRLAVLAGLVFFVFSAYELIHDHRLTTSAGAQWLLQGSFFALSILAVSAIRLVDAGWTEAILLSLAMAAMISCFVRFDSQNGSSKAILSKTLKQGKWLFFWGLLFDICLLF